MQCILLPTPLLNPLCDSLRIPARCKGWSYYARAFNMFREQPRAEIGWGQWTKPSSSDSFNEVCGVNQRGFTCQDNSGPEGCSGSYTDMEQCTYWVCGEEGLGGVRGSIEGGMGYWPSYTIETSQVKWNVPASTNANYEHYGGTFLGDREQVRAIEERSDVCVEKALRSPHSQPCHCTLRR